MVIISGDAMNENLEICIVCPLSTSIKGYAGSVFLKKNEKNNLTLDSEVICFQVRTISKNRLISKIGEIETNKLLEIKKKLLEVLTF